MMKARMHGADNLSLALKRLEALSEAILEDAVYKAAEPIRDEARRLAPRSKQRWVRKGRRAHGGHLADAIKITRTKRTARGRAAVRIGVKSKMWYGKFPEYGTVKMPAQPFMRPAADSKQDDALKAFADELRRLL